jgi:Asp/Glu/hydantoin racemase
MTGGRLVAVNAESATLGCAGMAHHRAAAEDACGVPVIEPSQAAATDAMSAGVAGRNSNA